MTVAEFPHAYPFRFVDRVSERTTVSGGHTVPPDPPGPGFGGRVRIRVTGNARVAMGEEWRSVLLYPEAIAQAIGFAIGQPGDVDVSEIIVRPTASPY